MRLNADLTYCFVFAHPDDDVFAAGVMFRLLEKGARVHAIWVTSGDARGASEVREQELSQAMALLALPQEHRHLMRLPNRGLLPILPQAVNALHALLADIQPDIVVATAYEGGHIDHDTVNFMLSAAMKHMPPTLEAWEFPLYTKTGPWFLLHWRIADFIPGGPSPTFLPLSKEALAVKFSMMRAYKSQRQDMLPFRMLMSSQKLQQVGEPYREIPRDREYIVPPHPGRLNYERRFAPGNESFAAFASAVKALM